MNIVFDMSVGVPRILVPDHDDRIVLFNYRNGGDLGRITMAGVGVDDRGFYHSWINVPPELQALIEAVREHHRRGPWRQLLDYLMTHTEDMPETFRIAFERFLVVVFPEGAAK